MVYFVDMSENALWVCLKKETVMVPIMEFSIPVFFKLIFWNRPSGFRWP